MSQLFALRWVLDPAQAVPGLGATVSEALAMGQLSGGGLTQQDLVHRLNLEKSTISRLIDGLIRKGWVEKERHPVNRRFQQVCLTSDGKQAASAIATAMHGRHDRWLASMTAEERKAVEIGLTALVRVMSEDFGHTGSDPT
jgi:DNA-binding MarR family transcriptional regulator